MDIGIVNIDSPWTQKGIFESIEYITTEFEWDEPIDLVEQVMGILDSAGYDSLDREMAFSYLTSNMPVYYESLYDAWLTGKTDPQTGKWVRG